MSVKSFFKNVFFRIGSRFCYIDTGISNEMEQLKILHAKLIIQDIKRRKLIMNLADVEFKVFSQWGEDGIIQYLISRIPIKKKIFVEFGVENYLEANTRFLLINDNWSGLVMDRDQKNISHIKNSELYWKYDISVRLAFVTRENINQLLIDAGITGDIGLLSIDIDGNDFWVWESISNDLISPRIVIIEYNSVFGADLAITTPYRSDFLRSNGHYSNLYYGASLKALILLAEKKGYVFAGANSAGNNAFFVRKDVSSFVAQSSIGVGYVESKFRESRDKNGKLSFLRGDERFEVLKGLIVYDVEKNRLFEL
jgi:hypothetical protein